MRLFQFGLYCLLCGFAASVGSEPLFQFQSLTKKEGLSSSVVYDSVQDQAGFMWFATEDGLQKYDGALFETYRQNRTDKTSISNNVVRVLHIDRAGRLWVGTDDGLNLYIGQSDSFQKVDLTDQGKSVSGAARIRTIYQTADGVIWVGTVAGLFSINPASWQTDYFPMSPVRAIFEDEFKQLWIGSLRHGLNQFDRNRKTLKYAKPLQIKGDSTDNYSRLSVIDIAADKVGRLLVATWGSGVFIIDKNTHELTPYAIELPSEYVRSIYQDDAGQLWFGTQKGILVYEPVDKSAQVIQAYDRSQTTLKLDNITSIYADLDNTIWVGTYGGGISRHVPSSRRFESYGLHPDKRHGLIDPVVYSLSENSDGNLWIGTESGQLSLFNAKSKTFQHFDILIDGKSNLFPIFATLQVDEANLLVGTSKGLYKYNFTNDQAILMSETFAQGLDEKSFIRTITQDDQNRIWIGVRHHGLQAYYYDSMGSLKKINGLFIALDDVSSIEIKSPNEILVASSSDGVFEVHLSQVDGVNTIQSLNKINHSGEYVIYDARVDWNNRIWLATWSDGIKVIGDNGNLFHLDELNGLPNNSVYRIIPDFGSNKIWASTNNGIVAINPESFTVESYNVSDGLLSNEFNRPGIKANNGFLYFGGVNGVDRFFPNVISQTLEVKKPILTQLLVANSSLKFDEINILKTTLDNSNQVTLKHDQTPFIVKFTSPQFIKPEELVFRYRLHGLSEQWIVTKSDIRQATYTNIEHGVYEFQLQIQNFDGSWNEQIASLKIEVSPPWWLTNSAKLVYLLLIIGLIVFVSLTINRKRLKEKAINTALAENEERLKLSLWGGGHEFWDWNIQTGTMSRSNEFKKIQIDCPVLSKNLRELANYVHPSDLATVRTKLTRHLAGEDSFFEAAYRVLDIENGWRWIQDRGKVVAINEKGEPLRMSGTQRDITDIREKDAQFEMLGQAFKSTSDGVWIRDHEWRLVECNPAFERITGFSFEEKKGEQLWFPDAKEQPENLLQRIRLSIEDKGSWQGEVWAERKDQEPFPQKLSIDTLHDESGNVRYYVGVFSDITFHKRTEEEFRKLANYDSLTGLPNRACLYDRLNQTAEKCKRDNSRFALFLIDIDNFKRINDSLGHNVGDHLIQQIASRLVNCNKEGDTVARIGGDEFVIVVENIHTSATVATFSELLLKELNQPIFVKGQQLKLNFSIGVTLAPDDAILPERILRNADTAMYEAKKSAENSYRFYSIEFNERAKKRLALENALRKAIDDEIIELFYQPKIDLKTGQVAGVEALARWTHRELGVISPSEFIPLAEDTGLIVSLGRQLLTKAIKQTKEWVNQGVMRGRTAVNLSANQFWNNNLANEISVILAQAELDPKYIELEITESACMQDIDETLRQIMLLKEIGLTLALDDFGTGYSSLSQLKLLPFDTIKVDKSFVDNIEQDEQDARVVKAVIDIAKTMQMDVVIEGVESKSQCEYLWLNRAYLVQGFYFSQPIRGSLCAKIFEKQWHKEAYLSPVSINVTPLS